MQPQAFLDGFRSARGMGMANTRNRFDRSADQDQTQSGNPGTIYNQAQFKAPPQSFHQQSAGRFPMARTRPGMPPQVAQMPPEQPAPYVAPNPGRTFNAPRFNTNTMFRGRQMNQ
jgi:hypothetical protein